MKTIVLIIIFLLAFSSVFAIYPTGSVDRVDTVYLSSGRIIGRVVDIKKNKLYVRTDNDNVQIVSMNEVRRIKFAKNFIPQVLLGETLVYKDKKYQGRVVYFDIMDSDILFYDSSSLQLIRMPLLETSLARKSVESFYKSSFYISVFFGVSSLLEAVLSFFSSLNIYLIAAGLLFVFSLSLFLLFGLPWRRHKKIAKK